MANDYIEPVSGLHRVADPVLPPVTPSTPHLATGFFLMSIVTCVAVFVSGTMDNQTRLAGVAVVSVVTSMIIFWMVVAQPTIDALAGSRSQHDSDQLEQERLRGHIEVATAAQAQTAKDVGRLGGLLGATHNELNADVSSLGSVVADVVEAADTGVFVGAPVVEQLQISFDYVEEGHRNVTAIARLGTKERTDRIGALRASDLRPLTGQTSVTVERDDEIYGDVELWKLFVKSAARNAEAHGQATEFSISSGDGRLTLSDNGTGCSSHTLRQAWKSGLRPNGTRANGIQLMRRIAEAHDALVAMHGEPGGGVRIVVDLRDLELDLRDRRVFPARVRTPHKASGGRVSTPSTK